MNKDLRTYLALGDSYTIGEAVEQAQSFPFQLTAALNKQGMPFTEPKVIARTGWTTDELQQGINEANIKQHFDLVSLLIGVNNQYRAYSTITYREEFAALLHQAIGFAGGNPKNVFVVSTPDWGVTPYAAKEGRDAGQVAKEIDEYNAIGKNEALKAGVAYVDITPGSRKAANNPSLIASDGLHPSGLMYTEWTQAILPIVDGLLKK